MKLRYIFTALVAGFALLTSCEKSEPKTQLEEVVAVIAASGEIQGLKVKQLWLPPLPTTLLLETCVGRALELDRTLWDQKPFGETVCGKVDIPEKQEQKNYAVDFLKNGHLAIYGSSGTGKSTLIQTIAYSLSLDYSPDMLNLFVLDFDGSSLASLATMPHCAGYASDSNEQAVEDILNTVQGIIAERREKFTQHHCANYESFIHSSTPLRGSPNVSLTASKKCILPFLIKSLLL